MTAHRTTSTRRVYHAGLYRTIVVNTAVSALGDQWQHRYYTVNRPHVINDRMYWFGEQAGKTVISDRVRYASPMTAALAAAANGLGL